jgi:3-oxoacyl-[acyl-carrier protein] reductase
MTTSSITTAGRVAVVTGAARGMGRAIAEGLASRGARVVAVDLRDLRETAAAIEAGGGECLPLEADVASEDAVGRLAGEVQAACGPCEILVNVAGLSVACPFAEAGYELWREVIRVNLDSQFLMAKAFVPDMITGGWGRIVNMASSSIYTTTPGLSAYMASKAGVLGLTSGLANDLGQFGITVNAVSPGLTRTPSVEEDVAAGRLSEAALEAMIGQRAIRRASTPEDLVGTVAFLVSDDAAFMTGQLLVADGGHVRPW